MYGSYRGYYKNELIYSSYEYIMCKIVEHDGFKFKTQEKTFDIKTKRYTPDIFVYNKKDELLKIIEIRGHRLNLEERIEDISRVKQIYDINIELYTEKDLRVFCKERGISYNKLKLEWRESKNTSFNKNINEFNPMYGKHHKDSTKKIIAKKASKRMEDEEYQSKTTKKMIEFNRKNNFAHTKKPRSKRVKNICPHCGKEFITTEAQSKIRKYCSNKCAGGETYIDAVNGLKEKTDKKYDKIREIVLNWANDNKDIIKNMKLNKISTNTKDLLNILETEVDVIDWRTITIATFDTSSRKEFALKLKEYIK